MTSISPDHASVLLQYFLPTVKNEHRTTRAVIQAIPESNADYRPDSSSRTAMELAWHIVAAEHRFYGGIVAGAFDFTPNHRPEKVRTPIQIAEWFDSSFEKNFTSLPNLSSEHLARLIDFRGAFQLPAVAYVDFTLRHTIHHRGQLSTYLRAMGGKVPAIYGESYDSAAAKASSATS
jgi:uncharacterized damage-inducible protein DinB